MGPDMLMFGGDPEAFLIGGNGFPIPAHRLSVPPSEKKVSTQNGDFFRDGYAVEFNPLPSSFSSQLVVNFAKLIVNFKAYTREHLWPKGIKLTPTPWLRIDLKKDIWEGPLDVRQFGCTPSLDAYSGGEEKKLAISATSFPFRSAGGHIHVTTAVGFHNPLLIESQQPNLVKLWDLYVGVPITFLLEEGRPRPFKRRKLYGSAGEYRKQKHGLWAGLEYRTLGPEVWFHDHALPFALKRMSWVVKNFEVLMDRFSKERSEMARDYINNGTPALARMLIEEDQPNFKPSIRTDWGRPNLSLRI